MGRIFIVLIGLIWSLDALAAVSCPTGQAAYFTSNTIQWNSDARGLAAVCKGDLTVKLYDPSACYQSYSYNQTYGSHRTNTVTPSIFSTTSSGTTVSVSAHWRTVAGQVSTQGQPDYEPAVDSTVDHTDKFFMSCGVCPDGQQAVNGQCSNACTLDAGEDHHWYAPIDVLPNQKFCVGGCVVTTRTYVVASIEHPNQLLAYGYGDGTSCTTESTANDGAGTERALSDGGTGVCQEGADVCLSKQKRNCGYVNGEYRCVTSSNLTDDHPCATTASGSVFCLTDAPNKPEAPKDESGNELPPDLRFQLEYHSGPENVSYWTSSTINSSPEYAGDDKGGDEAGKGDCGSKNTPCHVVVDSSGDGDGDGTGYGEGDGQCTGANCGTGAPGFGGVDSFGATLSKFVGDVQGSQIAVAMSHVGDAVPQGGTAPSACFNAFDQQYCYAVPDEVVASVQSILPLVMQAFWCLVGIFTFMKA